MSRFLTLFSIGGAGYCSLEILWRGRTHWTMFALGGICLYLLFTIYAYLDNTPVILKALIGGVVITAAEFVTGCIVNIILKWNVWNYSPVPYNFLGQICLSYSFLWVLLCIPIAFLCKILSQYI